MAGILVADGWMKGVAPKVELYVAKALSSNGSGDDGVVADAIDWCVDQGVHIISLSLEVHLDLSHSIHSLAETLGMQPMMQSTKELLLLPQREMTVALMMTAMLLIHPVRD